jgi:hemerythrin-like domain-containing protein
LTNVQKQVRPFFVTYLKDWSVNTNTFVVRSEMNTQDGKPIGAAGVFALPEANDPLVMFTLCHQRIRRQCGDLEALAKDLNGFVGDETARYRAAILIRFFDVDAHEHHEDEDTVFFPRLLALNIDAPAKAELGSLLDMLSKDHNTLHDVWRSLRQSLLGVVDGKSALASIDVTTFIALHQHHMHTEDISVLPFARRYFDSVAQAELQSAIMARRAARNIVSV